MTEVRSSQPCTVPGFERIANHQQVVDWFGCWPSFHDAEVHRVAFRRDPAPGVGTNVEIDLLGWLLESVEGGWLAATRKALVTFLFEDVTEVHLEGFNGQNVITALHLSCEDPCIRVEFEHCYQFECRFVAQHGRVIQLQPSTAT